MIALIFLVLAFVMLFRTFLTLEKADKETLIELVSKREEADVVEKAVTQGDSDNSDDEVAESLETESIYEVDIHGNKVFGFGKNENTDIVAYPNAKTVFTKRLKTVLYLLFFAGVSFLVESTIRFLISYKESEMANTLYVYNIIMVVGWILIYSLTLYFNNLRNEKSGINKDSERFAFIVATLIIFAIYINIIMKENFFVFHYIEQQNLLIVSLSIIISFLIIGIIRIIFIRRKKLKLFKLSLIIRLVTLPIAIICLSYMIMNIFVPVKLNINPNKYAVVSRDDRVFTSVQLKYILSGFETDFNDYRGFYFTNENKSVDVTWHTRNDFDVYFDFHDKATQFKINLNFFVPGEYFDYNSVKVYKSNARWIGFPFLDCYDAYLVMNFNNAVIEIELSKFKKSELNFSKYVKIIEDRLSNKIDGSFKLDDYKQKLNMASEKLNYGFTLDVLDAVDHAGQAFKQLERRTTGGENFYYAKSGLDYCDKMIIKYDNKNKAWLVQFDFGGTIYNAIINEDGDVLGAWEIRSKQQ